MSMTWQTGAMIFIYGAIVGSFLNVCIHRMPLREELVFTPSHCPRCQHAIAWWDNIPLISWLLLVGKCRHCQQPIAVRYPLVELAAALLALQTALRFGVTWESLVLVLLGHAFIVLTVIDLYHYILPDRITLPGISLGVLLAVLSLLGWPLLGPPFPDGQSRLIGVLVGGGGLWAFAWSFEKITGREGMGFGDVKLLAMIGAWMGWQSLPFTLFVASLVGSVAGITWIVARGRDRRLPIPFGPYLTLAAWLYLFVGETFYRWYLGLYRLPGAGPW